jgi:hypothetical protein
MAARLGGSAAHCGIRYRGEDSYRMLTAYRAVLRLSPWPILRFCKLAVKVQTLV